jgi:undecaprenyl-phosphate 4-deoxy-4-formamido-L-arabinose transferase
MSDKKNISVVIPVYNSSLNLLNLVDEIANIFKENFKTYELVLVDDKSEDNSWEVISSLCQKYDFVKGISLRKNVGQHNSLLAGIKHTSGEFIITMDDDGQNSPHDIIALYKEIKKGYDICYANYSIKKHNIFRKFASKFFNIFVTLLFNKPINLHLTSFRVFKSEIKDEVTKNKSSSIYLDGLLLSISSNISKISVTHNERKFGKSNYSFYKLFNLWVQMATGFSVAPLRLASILGLFFSIIGFIMSIWLVFFKIPSSEVPLGWTSLIVAILFLGGIQLVALGAIGEYLGRTYLSVNNYPQFSINKILNKEKEK